MKAEQGQAEPVRREENHFRQVTWSCRIKPGGASLPKEGTHLRNPQSRGQLGQILISVNKGWVENPGLNIGRPGPPPQAGKWFVLLCLSTLPRIKLPSCRRHQHRLCWGPSLCKWLVRCSTPNLSITLYSLLSEKNHLTGF